MATTKKSTSRRGKALPKRAQEMSKEELLLTLQKKRECNAKALKIVEGMLEPHVKEDWFLDVLQHINQSHLQDVSEERAITKLCGYPLCSHELKDIPSQQYRISTKLNKVYDIKERKNFCSNKCFKANKFIKDQMHTSPLWLRDIEPVVKFSLMPSSESGGGAGDEVIVQVERVTKEEINQLSEQELKISKTSLADVLHDLHAVTSLGGAKSSKHFKDNSEKLGKEETVAAGSIDETTSERESVLKPSSSYHDIQNESIEEANNMNQDLKNVYSPEASLNQIKVGQNKPGVEIDIKNIDEGKTSCLEPEANAEIQYSVSIEKQGQKHVACSNTVESENQVEAESKVISKAAASKPVVQNDLISSKLKENIRSVQKNRPEQDSNSLQDKLIPIIANVEKCLEEWFTMDTMCFLFGETALKDMLEQKGESIQAHYNALGTVTWDPEKHERFLAICKRLSLLDIEDNNFDNQVRNEGGKRKPLPDYNALKREAETLELKVKAFYSGGMEIEEKKVTFAEDTKSTDNSGESQPQLPLVHVHSQRALRKRIVLDGLNRVLPDFLRTFGMRPSDMTASIRGLVGTFALTPTNITFKPHEWSLLGLIVIKLLALREPELMHCLKREQSNTYLTLMLMSYKQEPGYLEHLLSWLTDIDRLLARPKDSEEQM